MSDLAIQALRAEIQGLRLEIQELRARVAELEGFEVITSEVPPGPSATSSFPPTTSPSQVSTAAPSTSTATSTSGVPKEGDSGSQSWEFRLEVAGEVGAFLRGSLEGGFRGPSGRDKILAKSRVYLLVRDWDGGVYTDPVKIFRTWRSLRPLVEKGGSFGSSIFVGPPSDKEAKAAVQSAGFTWPRGEN